VDGSPNTGGGAGGGQNNANSGKQGGSGIVVLRMPTSSYSGTQTGATVDQSTVANTTILIYNSSGSYTG
jgi:hypothetical protein